MELKLHDLHTRSNFSARGSKAGVTPARLCEVQLHPQGWDAGGGWYLAATRICSGHPCSPATPSGSSKHE